MFCPACTFCPSDRPDTAQKSKEARGGRRGGGSDVECITFAHVGKGGPGAVAEPGEHGCRRLYSGKLSCETRPVERTKDNGGARVAGKEANGDAMLAFQDAALLGSSLNA